LFMTQSREPTDVHGQGRRHAQQGAVNQGGGMGIGRRGFLVQASAATAATVMADAPSVIAQPKFQWRMSTAWPPQLDVMQGHEASYHHLLRK
jgi:hypothetical protein